jgi:hypothetical protein
MNKLKFFVTRGYGEYMLNELHYSQAVRIGDHVEIFGKVIEIKTCKLMKRFTLFAFLYLVLGVCLTAIALGYSNQPSGLQTSLFIAVNPDPIATDIIQQQSTCTKH